MAEAETPQLETLLNAVRRLEPLIREYADEAERHRRLSQPVVTALAEAGIFRLYTPHTLGGLEVDPLTFYRVVEAIARIDCQFGSGTTPHGKHFQGLLYRYPFYASVSGAIGAVALGITQGAVDACMELAQAKRPAGTTELL